MKITKDDIREFRETENGKIKYKRIIYFFTINNY